MESTERFSDRVENYVRYRPGYPEAVVQALVEDAGLTPDWVIADVGSGTGISSELFLRHGHAVFGVEPNAAMRAAAERLLAGYPGFRSVDGTAESTTLPEASVDCVVAGQAFHWFEPERTRAEFRRVLRPGGWVVLLWNNRLDDATPFLRDYEDLLREFGTDYTAIDHRNVDRERIRAFLRSEPIVRSFPNAQRVDLDGLRGRLLSSSYAPNAGHPRHVPMMKALERLFGGHERGGEVEFRYDTEMYLGRLEPVLGPP